jgi:hypothetical protein
MEYFWIILTIGSSVGIFHEILSISRNIVMGLISVMSRTLVFTFNVIGLLWISYRKVIGIQSFFGKLPKTIQGGTNVHMMDIFTINMCLLCKILRSWFLHPLPYKLKASRLRCYSRVPRLITPLNNIMTHMTKGPRGENVLGNFHMVMVNSLKTMIKRNPYHVLKALVTTHSVKHTS